MTEIRPNANTKMYVITCYKPQADDPIEFLNNLEHTLKNCTSTGTAKLLLLGDFNFPKIKWIENQNTGLTDHCKRFLNLCDTFGLHQFNKNPSTPAGNILELILSNNQQQFSDIIAGFHPFRSDHFILTFGIEIKVKKTP